MSMSFFHRIAFRDMAWFFVFGNDVSIARGYHCNTCYAQKSRIRHRRYKRNGQSRREIPGEDKEEKQERKTFQ